MLTPKINGVMVCAALVASFALAPLAMAENRIDVQRPDAPSLAAYGDHAVGVETLQLVNPDQINIAIIDPAAPKPDAFPRYDRPLTVEVWYPAAAGATGSTALKAFLRDGETEVELHGKGIRNAAPAAGQSFPLIMISHGYPGNRFLTSHLADNMASKGYVVVAIDHTDSTYRDQAAFGSTLINRTLDQLFVLNEMDRLSKDSASFLSGLVNADETAIVGYSMGGYGAVITAGGGLIPQAAGMPGGGPHGTLAMHTGGSDSHAALTDPRIKTILAIAPWGMNLGLWSADTLAEVKLPMLVVAGSIDSTAGYEPGVRQIWEASANVDRSLLTFVTAGHHVAAPIPAPAESFAFSEKLGTAPADHYGDNVWDTTRMNNILQHFTTAWMGKYLKGDAAMGDYLSLVSTSEEGIWAVDDDGAETAEHSYWKGFAKGSAVGLRFESLAKAN